MNEKEINFLGCKVIDGGSFSKVNVMGELISNGDLNVDELNVMGNAEFKENLNAKTIDILGPCKVNKNIKATEINIAGTLDVLGNVESTTFDSLGIVKISGDLNVDKASIHISPSVFNNIYGDHIEIVQAKHVKIHNKQFFKNNIKDYVTINEIEATVISLMNAKVGRVSGEDVTIYDGCEIDTVEYSKRLSIAKNVKINKIIKF